MLANVRVAAIDLGTNSLHLLIGEPVPNGRCDVRLSVKDTPRIGEGVGKTGRLSEDAMERTIRTLRQYSWICHQLGVHRIRAVATAAVRLARNGDEFIRRVHAESGIPLVVISGEEEALYSASGVLSEPTFDAGRFLIFNIGGGSTELAWGEHSGVRGTISLPIGAVTLTEEFLRHDPPRVAHVKAMERSIRDHLKSVPTHALRGLNRVHGTGGAVTSVVGFHEPFRFANDQSAFRAVSATEFSDSYRELSQMDLRERRQMLSIKTARAQIIVAGAAIAAVILERVAVPQLVVSRHGVKHGLILEELEKLSQNLS